MLVTFALITMEAMLKQGPPTPAVRVKQCDQVDQMISRLATLRKSWIESKQVDWSEAPELDELFSKTDIVMDEADLIAFDIRQALRKNSSTTVERAQLVQLFKKTKKAIRTGQKITHLDAARRRKIEKRSADTPPSDEWLEEYRMKKKRNKKAQTIETGRKRPLQCCMFVAVAFSQLLAENDMLAEYETEILDRSFDKLLSVDDGKTYQWSQIEDHSIARLTPPPERYPRIWLHEGIEDTVIPRVVRNPLPVGAPVLTNQLFPGASELHTRTRCSRYTFLTERPRIREGLYQLKSQQHSNRLFGRGPRAQEETPVTFRLQRQVFTWELGTGDAWDSVTYMVPCKRDSWSERSSTSFHCP